MRRKKKGLWGLLFGNLPRPKKKRKTSQKTTKLIVKKRRSHMVRKKDQHGEISWVRI